LTGRDEVQDARAFVAELRGVIELPLFYDSTEPRAIEEVLKAYPGRLVINSVNLEDGGKRLRQVAGLAKRFGAGLVVTCIDEGGMCMTSQRKVDCAKRIFDILQKDFGFKPSDIFIDALTFSLGAGDPSLRTSAIETFEAIRRVKSDLPGVFTILGVSNCSYGLDQLLRRYLNSVFLHHALKAGLDAAILNAGKVVPLSDIPENIRNLCEDLVFNRGEDPLNALLKEWERFGKDSQEKEEKVYVMGFVRIEDELKRQILQGDKNDLEAHLKLALKERDALSIVHEVLLEAMKEVGERFARGEMQLPFVLRSAEVMKACVSFLEPMMERKAQEAKGTIVLATVRGDVHDIGKNLVDILLSNNGFRVVNLGTKCPISKVIEAVEREKANAIGLSGLLVKSVMVMKEDVEELERQGRNVPVLLGGAALNRSFVIEEIAPRYSGKVFYCKDAFDGLKVMQEVCEGGRGNHGQEAKPIRKSLQTTSALPMIKIEAVQPPSPPFVGTQVIHAPPIEEIARFVDRKSLFRAQWQFKKGKMDEEAWSRMVAERLEPMFQEYLRRYYDRGVLKPQGVIGLFFANAVDNKVTLYDKNGEELAVFSFPKLKGGLCLADFVLPEDSGQRDVLGALVVTLGQRLGLEEKKLFEASRYTDYLFLHGLGVELTEALAQWAHKKVREALSISAEDDQDVAGILKGRYRGGRFSFGYPACPNLEDNKALLAILDAKRIGVHLTESLQMVPEQSVSALVFHHPQIKAVF
jgi:5-methyltetrahydrofolate--homocysteine methyltransferase